MPGAATPYAIGSDTWPGVSKLVEEIGELGQVLGKLIATGGGRAHWDGTDLVHRLEEELADVLAAVRFVMDENDALLDCAAIIDRHLLKGDTFRAWHQEQTARG